MYFHVWANAAISSRLRKSHRRLLFAIRFLNNLKVHTTLQKYSEIEGREIFTRPSFAVGFCRAESKKHGSENSSSSETMRRREANPYERGQDYRNGALYDYSYRDGNLRKPGVNRETSLEALSPSLAPLSVSFAKPNTSRTFQTRRVFRDIRN